MTKKWRVKYSGEHWIAYSPDARMYVFYGDWDGWHNALTLANQQARYEWAIMEPTA